MLTSEWRSANIRPGQPADVRRRTALQSLAERYRRFANLSLFMLLWCPVFVLSRIIPADGKVWIAGIGAVFFLTSSLMDRWLCREVCAIDLSAMPVSEVLGRAMFLRKRHLQFILILLPMASAFIGLIAYFTVSDPWFIYGIACGAIVGLAIGIYHLSRFLADYRALNS